MYLQNIDIHWQYDILFNPDKGNLKEGKNLLLFSFVTFSTQLQIKRNFDIILLHKFEELLTR